MTREKPRTKRGREKRKEKSEEMGGVNRVTGAKIEAKTRMKLSFCWRIWD